MTGFWKRLMGRRDQAALEQATDEQFETPAERHLEAEGVDGVAADELVEERLGGEAERLVDDEFKP
jgi:hypothetical protein